VADFVFQEGMCAVGTLALAGMTVFGGLNGELALCISSLSTASAHSNAFGGLNCELALCTCSLRHSLCSFQLGVVLTCHVFFFDVPRTSHLTFKPAPDNLSFEAIQQNYA